ncbi:inorganic phosphate transporter [Arthrobacter sp. TES]|uniref:Phosphate transporter n=1 Tax=Paenarthrobacter ureafaciens TaxID=37931 RepID=A0AAX3EQS0_PAEUR|nr:MULTISPECIES: inorganic phosphate transporter [Paenarthrobacter]AOY71465.1 phosphate transporter [Arthrobacter sp. ZXY-2]ERI39383.1 phosphate transporter [Arthrobacter sp. AK-YN10]NKR11619.1 phosphate transporter [Arthrobacter sp. M5]NKR15683.1 phosphate transporter [Arthrobacter sp. M6]OEH63524.1 phosphate transporter [Arthrobacter sp. D2]OEH65134.1 phosphate transporter [Arthrobacter sp. D4]QOI63320.1 inorganic phosphate transporter [Arthrobacter sp. TES]BCW84325.1 phosphate transporte
MEITFMVALVIALALFFDFTNGFHDTANAMATPIATGAIKPKTAVALAAVLNLVGAFLSTEVAKTISGGLIREGADGIHITPDIIFAGLMGAVLWNMITWLKGLPSSSSHALFGGLIGAAVAGIGLHSINFETVLLKVILPALFAPLIAGAVAYICTRLAYALTSRHDPETGDKLTQKRGGFRTGQIFTSSLVALAHGTNDAQKTMGIITLVLIAAGTQTPGSGPQFWVIAACAFAIAIGTYAGGWRIIRTMGSGLTEVKPAQGFSAETSTATAILASSHLGFALSTTQVASGSVIGSGLGRKGTSVRWGTAGKIALGWLFTLPASAIVGGLTALLVNTGVVGLVIAAVVGTAAILFMFVVSRREHVGHHNAVEVDEAGHAVVFRKKKKSKSNKNKGAQR